MHCRMIKKNFMSINALVKVYNCHCTVDIDFISNVELKLQ